MTDSHIISITQIKEFLKVDSAIKFKAVSKKEKYKWIDDVLNRFKYFSLRKKDRGIVRGYIAKMTGLSQPQLTRIIAKKKKSGKVFLNSTARHRFPRKYGATDIALLIETDNAHKRLSGPAIKRILKREYEVFGKKEYQNISQISPAHIYNLRGTRQYTSHSQTIKKTNPTKVPIGERRKPNPLKIINFHSDNGSEFINKVVARLLNKLLIQQTKSRVRHCNDNALIECKNGAIVRKHMGYVHIPANFAKVINQFYKEYFNIYLNYHRPCGFPTVIKDKKGKERKIYKPEDYQTPYEKLESLENAKQYLKDNVSFKILDKIAYQKSDNDFAQEMQKAKEKLFKNFKHIPQKMTEFTTFISCSYVD